MDAYGRNSVVKTRGYIALKTWVGVAGIWPSRLEFSPTVTWDQLPANSNPTRQQWWLRCLHSLHIMGELNGVPSSWLRSHPGE